MKTIISLIVLIALATCQQSGNVSFQFYYESLCPGCQEQLTTSWKEAVYTPGLLQIFDLTLYPYGHSSEQSDGQGGYTFTCPHGPEECEGDIMESCILAKTDYEFGLKSVICLEGNYETTQSWEASLDACALQFEQLNVDEIHTCMNSTEGQQLQHEAGVATAKISPWYVPWTVANGQHDTDLEEEIMENPVKWICQNYKGTVQVEACAQYTQPRKSKCFSEKTSLRDLMKSNL